MGHSTKQLSCTFQTMKNRGTVLDIRRWVICSNQWQYVKLDWILNWKKKNSCERLWGGSLENIGSEIFCWSLQLEAWSQTSSSSIIIWGLLRNVELGSHPRPAESESAFWQDPQVLACTVKVYKHCFWWY